LSFVSLRENKASIGGARNAISVQAREFVIRLGNDVLGELGWQVRDKVDVQVGTGPDAGKVRLEKHARGWSLLPPGGRAKATNGLIIKIKRTPDNAGLLQKPPPRLPATRIAPSVRDGGLEFRLPWVGETTEAAIARGVPVTICPPAVPLAGGGNPVRAKTSAWRQRNGRVS
jgi:hypothetical protein